MAITVAFIGAGSVGFTRRLVRDVLAVPELADTEFRLTDISERNLEMVEKLCRKDIAGNELPATVVATTDRREALAGTDYVVNCTRIGGLEAFRNDIEIPLKYGVDQCVGDTLCVGGIMYGQRNIPSIVDFCRGIREVRPGKRRTVKGSTDRQTTEALARKLETEALLAAKGVVDPSADRYAKAEAKPLMVTDEDDNVIDGHLADFHASLQAKGTTRAHANQVRTRVKNLLGQCRAERISDLTASSVQTAVAAFKDKNGLSLQTANHYLRAIKQFSRWLNRDRRTREDALAHLSGYNVRLDRRHDRRALTDEEIVWLLDTAENGETVLHMSGPDRAMLYRLALGTGFRAGELRSLTPESFGLDGDPPTVTVEAGYSKHRREDVQPIRADLAEQLRPWLAVRPAGEPVFNMPYQAVDLIRADLATARQRWIEKARGKKERKKREASSFLAYRDGDGKVADFHALRHTYISRLVKSGVNIKVAQELARHSTPELTLGRYAHVQIYDQSRALDALPDLEPKKTRKRSA